MDLLDLATLLHFYVINNLPLAFAAFIAFGMFLFMMLFSVMLLLDVLVYEQFDVFVSRQSHRHLIDCIPKHALNGVFIFSLLETIVPVLLRGR